MFLMFFGKPSRRKGTEMQVVLEFSPLGFCSGLMKYVNLFFLGNFQVLSTLALLVVESLLCLIGAGEGADVYPVGQQMDSGSHPTHSRQAQAFLTSYPD